MNRRDFLKYGVIFTCAGGVCLLCKNPYIFKKDTPVINNTLDTRPCKIPFENIEIYEKGTSYPCCPGFLKYRKPLGYIGKQSFDEVWNGELFNDLRQRVLKGDFSKCKRDICCNYTPCSADEIPADYTKGPKEIKICYDYECNYNCITCRDKVIINTPEQLKIYNEVYLPKIMEAAKNARMVHVTLTGDALFSRHSKSLMQKMVEKYPNIKLSIYTNGYYLEEKYLTDLGIQNNIDGVSVSVDAAKRETYKKILRTDAFDLVINNIRQMSEWKKQGRIDWITMNFVVHLMNYKEMPAFVKLAQSLGALAHFTTYAPWPNAEYHKRYMDVAVFEPVNEYYKDFVKILHNPIFKDEKLCYLEPCLMELTEK